MYNSKCDMSLLSDIELVQQVFVMSIMFEPFRKKLDYAQNNIAGQQKKAEAI